MGFNMLQEYCIICKLFYFLELEDSCYAEYVYRYSIYTHYTVCTV